MFRTYYNLTKPGIIYGNLLTAAAGFLLATKSHFAFGLFIATLAGTALVIGAACVVNNYIDRSIDKVMTRTKKRALVIGTVSSRQALTYAAVLGVVGFLILGFYTTALVTLIGVVAVVDYVILYGLAKRRSVHGTLVGSIAGATPILAGYVAARGHLDLGAALVFLILVLWQMPHFYAISLYRFDDYKAAGIPVLPVVRGIQQTKIQIVIYIAVFAIVCDVLALSGYAGIAYFVVITITNLIWLRLAIQGFGEKDYKKWARRLFLFSLIIILVLSVMLSIGTRL
jgi:protoheme IX farnesyltransferase